jgi:hypothetical protein
MALQDELQKDCLGALDASETDQPQILAICRPGGKGQPWGKDDLAPQRRMPNVI